MIGSTVASPQAGPLLRVSPIPAPGSDARPADIAQAQVHLPVRVGKHAIAEQALEQPIGLRLSVVRLDSDQYQQAAPDRTDLFARHHHARRAYALQQADHAATSDTGSASSIRYNHNGSVTVCVITCSIASFLRQPVWLRIS